ncbi:hypothetical protein HK405_015570, partial [Cladochytrium tenue]
MADNDDDPPPLEDMSAVLKRIRGGVARPLAQPAAAAAAASAARPLATNSATSSGGMAATDATK